MATAQATAAQAITKTQSLALVKNIIRTTISSVCYLRGLFDESAFSVTPVAGMPIHLLKRGAGDSSNALERRYLKTIVLAVFAGGDSIDSSTVIESYKYRIQYPSDKEKNPTVKMTRHSNGSSAAAEAVPIPVDTSNVKEQTLILLRTLIAMCGTLSPLPPHCFVSLQLYYYEDITPPVWQPRHFEDVTNADHRIMFASSPLVMKMGTIQTSHHVLELKVHVPEEGVQQKQADGDEGPQTATDADDDTSRPVATAPPAAEVNMEDLMNLMVARAVVWLSSTSSITRVSVADLVAKLEWSTMPDVDRTVHARTLMTKLAGRGLVGGAARGLSNSRAIVRDGLTAEVIADAKQLIEYQAAEPAPPQPAKPGPVEDMDMEHDTEPADPPAGAGAAAGAAGAAAVPGTVPLATPPTPAPDSDEAQEASRLLLRALVWLGENPEEGTITVAGVMEALELQGTKTRQQRLAQAVCDRLVKEGFLEKPNKKGGRAVVRSKLDANTLTKAKQRLEDLKSGISKPRPRLFGARLGGGGPTSAAAAAATATAAAAAAPVSTSSSSPPRPTLPGAKPAAVAVLENDDIAMSQDSVIQQTFDNKRKCSRVVAIVEKPTVA